MPLTLTAGLIVLVVIGLVAVVGYWIDESEEPLERDTSTPGERSSR